MHQKNRLEMNIKKVLKSALIYEVYPRNHGPGHHLRDVTADLPRIKELQTDILWLMPHYPVGVENRKGSKGSPYAIRDYRKVDPELGTIEDFRELVNQVHKCGMLMIIDVVFNHTARDNHLINQHPSWYLTDGQGQPKSKVPDWSDVFDLNFSKPELRQYLIQTLEYWAEQGVDGFRCDVASLVPLDFWIQARRTLNARYNLIWLAESVHRSFVRQSRRQDIICHSDPELHQAFDLTYDYDGFEILQPAFQDSRLIKEYLKYLEYQDALYPASALKLRFLENHDVPRIAHSIKEPQRLRDWTLFSLLLPGPNLIYSGQEFGETVLPSLFEYDLPVKARNPEFHQWFIRAVQVTKSIKQKCRFWEVQELAEGVVKIDWWSESEKYSGIVSLTDRIPNNLNLHDIKGCELLVDYKTTRQENSGAMRLTSVIQVKQGDI